MDKLNLCAGILCIIIAIIGITTNLLTLLAIPFAAKRKKYASIHIHTTNLICNIYEFFFRFNLHKRFSDKIFILNLAFGDLLYCGINLPMATLTYLGTK